MSAKWLFLLPFFLQFSAIGALKRDCPWLLAEFLSPHQLANMDPSDRSAVQGILVRVYKDPNGKLTTTDEQWLKDFPDLEGAVPEIRAQGLLHQKVQKKEKAQRRNRAIRWMAPFVLTPAVLGGLFMAGGDLIPQSRHWDDRRFIESVGCASHDRWWKDYGLSLRFLTYDDKGDADLLRAMLQGEPGHIPYDLPSVLRRPQDRNQDVPRFWIKALLEDSTTSDGQIYELLRYWNEHRMVFTGPWGTASMDRLAYAVEISGQVKDHFPKMYADHKPFFFDQSREVLSNEEMKRIYLDYAHAEEEQQWKIVLDSVKRLLPKRKKQEWRADYVQETMLNVHSPRDLLGVISEAYGSVYHDYADLLAVDEKAYGFLHSKFPDKFPSLAPKKKGKGDKE